MMCIKVQTKEHSTCKVDREKPYNYGMKNVLVKYIGYKDVATKIAGETDMEVLENTFAAFNRGSNQENKEFIEAGVRSLSVNDLVRVEGLWYQCKRFGWEQVTDEYVEDLEDAVFTHPTFEPHGGWFALGEVMHERNKKFK